ncbi:hypothetical protein TrVE_jg7082 [Triparma verrucosa]|uniref:Amino acid transporter transmembrane domain-containing protein n=1 Tax=Triparma verrucosa TaxID=1606542 RepID=A0A9W7KSV2_9STRA|nr:hypothetical protein TrVE_jg7082 [Triparma verrucosa]
MASDHPSIAVAMEDDPQPLEAATLLSPSSSGPSFNSSSSPSSSTSTPSITSPWAAGLLISAEVVGTGILALPFFCSVITKPWGLSYLALNIGVNYYAGARLTQAASIVEQRHHVPPILDLLELSQLTTLPNLTLTIYYTNLILVMGSYLLTISTSFSSLLYPLTVPSSILTFLIVSILIALSLRLNSMAKLGKAPTYVSITTILVVVLLSLIGAKTTADQPPPTAISPFQIPGSLSGISFAVSSQKLLLNVRKSMDSSSKLKINEALFVALAMYGLFYVITILVAPSTVPPLLLNVLKDGSLMKRIAGLLLSVHLVISFTINNQCLCHSFSNKFNVPSSKVAFATCFFVWAVSNGIPFFEDLTSLIGALTTVPLTLALPVLYAMEAEQSDWNGLHGRMAKLIVFVSVIITVSGVLSSFWKINKDWTTTTTKANNYK